MGSVKRRLAGMLAAPDHGEAIDELRQRVDALTGTVARLEAVVGELHGAAAGHEDALRRAVDDLGARINTLGDRVGRLEA